MLSALKELYLYWNFYIKDRKTKCKDSVKDNYIDKNCYPNLYRYLKNKAIQSTQKRKLKDKDIENLYILEEFANRYFFVKIITTANPFQEIETHIWEVDSRNEKLLEQLNSEERLIFLEFFQKTNKDYYSCIEDIL